MFAKKLVLFALPVLCFSSVANAAPMELLECAGRNARGTDISCLRDRQSPSQQYASLMDLYAEGWRLIATQTQHIDMGGLRTSVPYVFFLERPKGEK